MNCIISVIINIGKVCNVGMIITFEGNCNLKFNNNQIKVTFADKKSTQFVSQNKRVPINTEREL